MLCDYHLNLESLHAKLNILVYGDNFLKTQNANIVLQKHKFLRFCGFVFITLRVSLFGRLLCTAGRHINFSINALVFGDISILPPPDNAHRRPGCRGYVLRCICILYLISYYLLE